MDCVPTADDCLPGVRVYGVDLIAHCRERIAASAWRRTSFSAPSDSWTRSPDDRLQEETAGRSHG
jgi:hypothetical protein